MNTIDKAEAIELNAIREARQWNSTTDGANRAAIGMLAMACALLTSTSKEERERGKVMVRQWKHGANFGE